MSSLHGRFVISTRRTGIGDRLASLAAAWLFARQSGRTLVADWRFGRMAPDPAMNAFPLYFEPVAALAGVPFLLADGFQPGLFPAPRFPSIWNEDAMVGLPFLRPLASMAMDESQAVAMIREKRDVAERTVVFDGCINDGLVRLDDAKAFLAALRPTEAIAGKVAAFRATLTATGQPTIGIHIRHGNGGDIMGHAPFWRSFDAALDRCVRAVAKARLRLGATAALLLCTDSAEVLSTFTARVANVVTRDKQFRPAGAGELHAGPGAGNRGDDAVAEMLLLAACDAVIRYPSGSFFSFYPAAMMAKSSGAATVYDLQTPWDPADPMGAAIVYRHGDGIG